MVSYREIARVAGCSAATVSRAFNTPGRVAPPLLRAIREAETRLRSGAPPVDPTPARQGRLVGVLIPSMGNPVFATILSALQRRLRLGGYGVLIAQSNYEAEEEGEAVETLLAERPAGLILTLCDAARPPPSLVASHPPCVFLHQPPAVSGASAAVTLDNRACARQLTDLVLAAGHRRLLFLSGNFTASDRARARYEGFCDSLRAAGLPVLPASEVSFVDDYAHVDLTETMERHRPTAIVASNDLLALGAMGALRRLGLAIPEDVSVVGFDGIELGRLAVPTLATMELPNQAMGACAASLLLDMVERGAPSHGLDLPFGYRPGGSLGPPPPEASA
ncbi:LacI family DNA-binding transcriptional regulator [Aureimonas sp. AU40]|uniref:LacI family DNA-binding transcriptional regulator n=1 Tax=Aureimonas sp. AU40 TaxID=1637747 RepID=UPI0007822879|nr:LacI family DNA-binding transcriptional regulator [Aureimonas sp. AU40]